MRSKREPATPSSFALIPFSTRSSKKAISCGHRSSTAPMSALRKDSARSTLSLKLAKASSGSIIQNSARCRLVLEFSARKVGPKV